MRLSGLSLRGRTAVQNEEHKEEEKPYLKLHLNSVKLLKNQGPMVRYVKLQQAPGEAQHPMKALKDQASSEQAVKTHKDSEQKARFAKLLRVQASREHSTQPQKDQESRDHADQEPRDHAEKLFNDQEPSNNPVKKSRDYTMQFLPFLQRLFGEHAFFPWSLITPNLVEADKRSYLHSLNDYRLSRAVQAAVAARRQRQRKQSEASDQQQQQQQQQLQQQQPVDEFRENLRRLVTNRDTIEQRVSSLLGGNHNTANVLKS
ncbi:hypothetical protein KR222_010355 [Zaprionus bogoriensis]|nr:hypothetical protein KR222_010355 [Zaprionus bogoriensis]